MAHSSVLQATSNIHLHLLLTQVDSVLCCPHHWIIISVRHPHHSFVKKLRSFSFLLSVAKDPDSRGVLCFIIDNKFCIHWLWGFTVYAICIQNCCSNWQTISHLTNTERNIYLAIVCDSLSSGSAQIMCFVFMKTLIPVDQFLESNCFFLPRRGDKRVRGTASVIVICIAIENCCGKAFTRPLTFMSTLDQAKWVAF